MYVKSFNLLFIIQAFHDNSFQETHHKRGEVGCATGRWVGWGGVGSNFSYVTLKDTAHTLNSMRTL